MDQTLIQCATGASHQLSQLWDVIGVGAEERAAFLAQVAADVAATYASRVASQADRRAILEAEIDGLRTTIEDMQVAMEEPVDVVRGGARAREGGGGAPLLTRARAHHTRSPLFAPRPTPLHPQPTANGATLIVYRDALEGARVKRQEAWDAQCAALKRREAALFQLYADIGAGIEPAFAAIGDRISTARALAYDGEIARVAAVKAARGAEIGALAGEVAGLWEELGFGPKDEYDAALAGGEAGRAALGWGTSVIDTLRGKVGALCAEKAAREDKIMRMGQGITTLWKRLATSEEEQTAFLEAHAGIGDDVIVAVRARGPLRHTPRRRAAPPHPRPLAHSHHSHRPRPPPPPRAVRGLPGKKAGRVCGAHRGADQHHARRHCGHVGRAALARGRARSGLPRLLRAPRRLHGRAFPGA